jgi:ABC-type phosphate/phosphonate transport system substrate-binding protein
MKAGNVKPVLVNQTQGSYGYVYYLISRKDKGFDKLSDLQNGRIRILARNDGQTPSIWLEKLLRDKKLPKKDKFFKEISFDFVPTNVILPVYFNKLDAAIVTKASFELICELNPKLLKEFNILDISSTLLFGVMSFDNRNNDEEREKFVYNILTTMHNDVDGQQFLNLFSLEKIIPYKEIYLNRFLELYK